MIQSRDRARLTSEALAKLIAHDLEGNRAIEARVQRSVDAAHAARPKHGFDPVGPNCVPALTWFSSSDTNGGGGSVTDPLSATPPAF